MDQSLFCSILVKHLFCQIGMNLNERGYSGVGGVMRVVRYSVNERNSPFGRKCMVGVVCVERVLMHLEMEQGFVNRDWWKRYGCVEKPHADKFISNLYTRLYLFFEFRKV